MRCGETLDFDTWCGRLTGKIRIKLILNSFSHETAKWKDSDVVVESAWWPSAISTIFGCTAAFSKRQFEDWRETCGVEKHLILTRRPDGKPGRLE